MYAPSGYKAVCFRCSYEACEATERRCPVCRFPFILEPDATPPGGRKIEEILRRASVSAGAPPLPGVDREKRKAQLLAESRRQKARERVAGIADGAVPPSSVPAAVAPRELTGSVRAAGVRLLGRLTFALLCVSAVAAGALAAVLQRGL